MIQKSAKHENKGRYPEAIILYMLLFLLPSAAALTGVNRIGEGSVIEFSTMTELVRIFLYVIPSIALIFYLMHRSKIDFTALKPHKKDLILGLITLPSLLVVGIIISYVSIYVSGSIQITYITPSTVIGWLVLCISCLFSAYLEEIFFRFYLLSIKNNLNIRTGTALLFSAALFAICHIYEGPWGFLNAAISGFILGLVFIRYKCLHGISVAHALYNITTFVLHAVTN